MALGTRTRQITRWNLVWAAVPLVFAGLVFGVAPQAHATTLEAFTLEQLSARATRIVIAETLDTGVQSLRTAGGNLGTLETVAQLRTSEVLKGSPVSTLEVSVPGGKLGDLSMVVDGMPVFAPGETCLLFLDDQNRVIGGTQGKLDVVKGAVVSLSRSLQSVCSQISAVAGTEPVKTGSVTKTGPVVEKGQVTVKLDKPLTGPTLATAGVQYSVSTLFQDGFEAGMGNWTAGGSPNWAATSYRAYAGSYSAYCVGSGVAAPGPYPVNADSRMVAGPFNLTSANVGSLDFDLWLDSESGSDAAYYLISTDGVNFYGSGWSGCSAGWLAESINLASVPDGSGGYRDVTGQNIWVMFRFLSNASVCYEGAYVDSVTLRAGTMVAPSITSITPGAASAGTGSNVTIAGTNFGASQGSGHVDFFYKTGQPTISAPIVSWSDTSIVAEVPTAVVNGYPASAGSGPVMVTDSTGTVSNGYAFEVTFGYGGIKQSGLTCTYVLNANTADTTDEESLFDEGAATWNPASAFKFVDGGSTSATAWSKNGSFEVFWANDLASGVLAAAAYWYEGSTFLEGDIKFNDRDYTWSSGGAGTHDIQSIAAHELGHWLNLRDLYGSPDSAKVMYGFGSSGTQKRALDFDDAAGILWVYGGISASPTVTGLSITSGPASGGTSVIITGTGFTGVTAVTFGGTAAAYHADSGTQITATAPAHAAGPVQVQVTAIGGPSGNTSGAEYTYVAAPAVTGLSVSAGPTAGGTPVIITGTGFTGVTAVTFGGTAAVYHADSGTQITATAPAHAAGPVQVQVTAIGGPSGNTSGDDYTYVDAPTVVGLSPPSGVPTGGNTVVITGTGFTADSVVKFGGTSATSRTVNSATGITAIAPAHAMGKVDVTVTTPGGTSSVSGTGNDYLYAAHYEETSTKLGYSGTWTSGAGSGYSGGAYKKGTAAGSTVVVKFSGNYLAWLTTKRADLGIARVSLDYGTPVMVDLYRSVTAHKQKVWTTPATLASGTHTLIIEWTGKKNASSSGTSISMDAFDVLGTLSQAPVRYQQGHTKVSYSTGWTTVPSSSASAGTYRYATAANAKVTVKFTGTSITWVGVKSANYGKAKVTLDGVYKGTVDLYSASTKWGVKLFSTAVPAGNHTLVITCTGTKQTGSTGKRVGADAFDVLGTLR